MKRSEGIAELLKFMHMWKVPLKNWYVGLTSNPLHWVLREHQVTEVRLSRCIEFDSAQMAREAEDFFIKNIGTDGGPGDGDAESRYVFAFLKTRTTSPPLIAPEDAF